MTSVAGLQLGLEAHIHTQLCNEFPTVEAYVRSTKRVNSDAARDQALAALDRYIVDRVAPLVQSGITLFNTAAAAPVLPTRCPGVDRVLGEGLRPGQLTEFFGETGSGKTMVCLLAALSTAMEGYRVVWVDTCSAFSPRQLETLFSHRTEAAHPNSRARFIAALKLVQVHKVTRAQSLQTLLQHLSPLFAEEESRKVPLPKLIIVDSLAAVITPLLGNDTTSQGHTVMTALARQMKVLADRFGVAVLVTQPSSGDVQPRPVLGEGWNLQPHTRVQLARLPHSASLCRVTLTATQLHACGRDDVIDLAQLQAAVPAGER
mmetsp:Transcript_16740/g.50017  ORF Transcript_16740/g.50017 Transcript_16740/m.50017 type:complete len:318 (+) Transcript_16740:87-1040(+)|eukprot:CAMPEP_0206137084 /NCGR_PEP_ID=MMETSP1473-20131121/2266_1 /ASSEMBLY_ACC=CAM_ASM_001109 /TAXON_ID=1461547 /ORGANISM="Stichococcus sp, Strain RCC1054" /LENGTH=317 /DNA_ID=CAMNT_0053530001 /DNA_START=69 /DNA_END=1022 /DNA_ORIENTATION=-